MSLQTTTAPSSGVWNAVKGALNIFSSINKAEGVSEVNNPTPIDEYQSDLPDEEILDLISQFKKSYNAYYKDGVEESQTLSFEYWIGKHGGEDSDQVKGTSLLVDNKIFEAIETFIPIATRANPDPLVQADPSDLGQKMANDLKTALVYEADRLKLRKVLKGVIRNWIICRLGLVKIGYDNNTQQTTIEKINPKRWMGDKDGYWDESCHFTGEWQAEKKQATAASLIQMFPDKEQEIMDKAGDKKGTKIEYIEWWYKDKDVFYTLDDETVLGKYKNPHWNYDVPGQPPQMDQMGNVMDPGQQPVEGQNHFLQPRAPYVGLSIFTTSIQPHDETSLVLQNIPLQNSVNKISRQIEKNVEGMNNGIIVSNQFTAEQASQAATALRRGVAIRAPSADVRTAAMRFPPGSIPTEVFKTLQDRRDELRNIFGTSASTPQGVDQEQTARGKIMANQLDSSRIGGGVTEYLEQVADSVYNWFVQIMFVHWTDPHYIVAAGAADGQELVQLKNTDLALFQTLDITVKDGSLIPKDPLTQRNEAIDLWSAGAIDPITFYRRLDFSDPMEAATQLLTWQMVQKGQLPPQAYIPTFGQQNPVVQQVQQQQQMAAMQPQPIEGKTGSPADNQAQKGVENNPVPESVGAQGKQLLQSVPLR